MAMGWDSDGGNDLHSISIAVPLALSFLYVSISSLGQLYLLACPHSLLVQVQGVLLSFGHFLLPFGSIVALCSHIAAHNYITDYK